MGSPSLGVNGLDFVAARSTKHPRHHQRRRSLRDVLKRPVLKVEDLGGFIGMGDLENEAIAAGGRYQKVAVPLAVQLQGRALNSEVPGRYLLGLAPADGGSLKPDREQ